MKKEYRILYILIILFLTISCSTTNNEIVPIKYKLPNDISENSVIHKYLEAVCEKEIEKNPSLGTKGEMQLIYTISNITQKDGSSYYVFFIVNRSGSAINNDFELIIDMSYKGKEIFKRGRYFYDYSLYGDIPNNYLTPIAIRIEKDKIKYLSDSKSNDKDVSLDVDYYAEE